MAYATSGSWGGGSAPDARTPSNSLLLFMPKTLNYLNICLSPFASDSFYTIL